MMPRKTPNRRVLFGQCAAVGAFVSFVLLAALPVRATVPHATAPGPALHSLTKMARQAFECSQSLTLGLPVAQRDVAPLQRSDRLTQGELCAGHSLPVSGSLHDRAPPAR